MTTSSSPSPSLSASPELSPELKGSDDHRILDTTFKLTMLAKGLDGVLETAGGLLLLVVAPATINRLVIHLTQHELSRDPNDLLSRHLLHLSGNLHKTQLFGALYLLSHGVAKIVLVGALLRRQRWAYPATFAFLGAFIVYQLYRMIYVPSVGLVLLTIFDLFIVWLVWREYKVHGRTHSLASP